MPRGSCGSIATLTRRFPALLTCSGPPCLSTVGKSVDPGLVARKPPFSEGDAMGSRSTHFNASFDHQASATLSFSFPCLFLPDARQTVFNLCLVPPKGYARMEPVPRFDRARNSDAQFSTVVLG